MDAASGAAISEVIEPNSSPALRMARDSEEPDSFPNSEIMEFTAADIFQHSPFDDILNSLKSLSLSESPGRTTVSKDRIRMMKKFKTHPPPTS